MTLRERPQPCIVRTRRGWVAGMLYFQTRRHVILVNHISDRTDLGPLRRLRREHLEPEATVHVIPREDVQAIDILRQA